MIKRIISISLALVMMITISPVMTGKVKGTTINVLSGPTFKSTTASNGVFKRNIHFNIYGQGTYKLDNNPKVYNVTDTRIKLFKNGKLYATKKVTGSQVEFAGVAVSYGKNDIFKAALFMYILGKEIAGPTQSFALQGTKVPNIIAYATKLNKKKANVRWQKLNGATGYYIYMGKKKVKTVTAKKNKVIISKKNAGSKKYKVVPYIKNGKTIAKGSSNTAKPKKNQFKWNRAMNVKSDIYPYATCRFVVTKISLTGKTYTVTGYAMNNRMWDVEKYKSLKIDLKIDGKKAFSKKFKNIKLKIKKYKKKKFVFKIKGKADRDIAYGVKSLSVNEDADWGFKNDNVKD